MKTETATLAGGCFWCLEAVFDELKGVQSVESGYMGGKTPNPNYEQVCSGTSGHAEVVRVTFDPDGRVSSVDVDRDGWPSSTVACVVGVHLAKVRVRAFTGPGSVTVHAGFLIPFE